MNGVQLCACVVCVCVDDCVVDVFDCVYGVDDVCGAAIAIWWRDL